MMIDMNLEIFSLRDRQVKKMLELREKTANDEEIYRELADMVLATKTCIKCEIDAQGKPYESVREEIENICAEHEGKRGLQIVIKKLSANDKWTKKFKKWLKEECNAS